MAENKLLIPDETALFILNKLDALSPHMKKNLEKFKEEAPERDEIVRGYFGESGINKIVSAIADSLRKNLPRKNADILDVGCGTGTFTRRIKKELLQEFHTLTFYGLDPTWHMLNELLKKDPEIICGVGIIEKLKESLELNNKLAGTTKFPQTFDAIISTLAFHHLENIELALSAVVNCLKPDGFMVICDTEPYDYEKNGETKEHHGIIAEHLATMAKKYFREVKTTKLKDTTCCVDDLISTVFVMELKNPIIGGRS